MMRLASLILCALAMPLAASADLLQASLPAGSKVWQPLVEASEPAQEGRGVAFLAEALAQGAHALLPLPSGLSSWRSPGGALTRECLSAILQYQGPLYFLPQDQPALDRALARFPGLNLDALAEPTDPMALLALEGRPRLMLVENSSSISPLSKALAPWGLQPRLVSFSDVERAPQALLSPQQADLVAFSSPGWWDDFANPPSGPSRMKEPVVQALRSFVAEGGSAVFTDLAQWDLLKAWPGTVRLAPLGPYKASKFKALGRLKGGKLALAPFGVAADQLGSQAQSLTLLAQAKFSYGSGKPRLVAASYALTGLQDSKGLVFGQALHPFEQDDDAAFTARRLFLNTVLASMAWRSSLWDGSALKQAAPATALPSPSESPTPLDSPTSPGSPSPSASPTASLTGTGTKTLVKTATPSPSFSSTPSLTLWPTLRPTPRPALPAPTSKARPSATSTATRTFTASPLPTRALARPALPPLPPTATALPTPRPWPTLAPTPRPRLKPKARARSAVARKRLLLIATPSPTKTPTPLPLLLPSSITPGIPRNALSGLHSAPEPFTTGGAYLYFSLKAPATVMVRVYASSGGAALREVPGNGWMLGSAQIFYDGLNAKGGQLAMGLYYWEVEARFQDSHLERRYATFTRR
jgi:hypothetical protein